MFEIIGFYFQVVAKFFTDIFQSWEIFPGIGYGVWLIGIMLFCAFLSIVYMAIRRDINFMADDAVAKNREIWYREQQEKKRWWGGEEFEIFVFYIWTDKSDGLFFVCRFYEF